MVPPGFAHGFLVLSETADFLYKTTRVLRAGTRALLLWNDPEIGVDWWPLVVAPCHSAKDHLWTPASG
ncbi:dTDP-4-dehydrorhamnose 3,5-epimerase family protein [Candidatus Accumulibacter sp. ACC005]|uniref:dTDP-4-dehydrorhamnose 3,5-epimerase family protein n=1 Tax=Candidatus Accumulibacter sp. ACC005 TaxID=2823331 RepID=UPI0034408910